MLIMSMTNDAIDLLILSPNFEDRLEARSDLMRLRRGIDDRIEPHPLLPEDFNEHHILAAEVMHNGMEIRLHPHTGEWADKTIYVSCTVFEEGCDGSIYLQSGMCRWNSGRMGRCRSSCHIGRAILTKGII